MKVFFNTQPLENNDKFRGVGNYTRNLLNRLKKQADKGELALAEKISQADLVHYPFFSPFFLSLPKKMAKPTVVTIHDLIQLQFPDYFPPGFRGSINWRRQKRRLAKTAGVITVSQHSKQDIVKLTNYPAQKISVTPLAAQKEFRPIENESWLEEVRQKHQLPEKFVLYVGDINYNKNVPGLVKAARILEIPLVVVGKAAVTTDFDRDHIENQDRVWFQKQREKMTNLICPGFITTKDLIGIYNLATLYCQPSFYEGFGLPVLEAMACGCPVLSSNQASLPEVGGEAAAYFNPHQSGDLKEKLTNLYSNFDRLKQLSRLGIKRAKQFSWSKTARQTIQAYERALS